MRRSTSTQAGSGTSSPRAGREHRGDVLVSPDPRHLLDEVLGALHVLPPARDAPPTTRLGREAKRPEDGADLLLRHRRAEEPVHVALAERHDARLGRPRMDVDAPAANGGTGELGHQRRGVVQHLGQHRPVHPALEAVRGLAVQLVAAGHPPDGARVPVRRLEQHAGRLLADLGVRPAHRARQRLRSADVLDDQVVGDQRPLLAVERGQRLALARPAHPEQTALDPVQVEGVHRLPELEHHVVGDVDHVADAPDPAALQPPPEPGR